MPLSGWAVDRSGEWRARACRLRARSLRQASEELRGDHGGIVGEDVRGLKVAVVKHRFGSINQLRGLNEWLTNLSSCDLAQYDRCFACELRLLWKTPPKKNPQSKVYSRPARIAHSHLDLVTARLGSPACRGSGKRCTFTTRETHLPIGGGRPSFSASRRKRA